MMKSDEQFANVQASLLHLSKQGPKLPTLSGGPLQIQGHRGGFQPDNTLASFKMALDHQIEGIELDVS